MKIKFLMLLLFSLFAFGREVIEDSGSCKINWTEGFILCEGESAQGQDKYAANISAKVISHRNMLEVIKGVSITSEVTIENGLDSSEVIKSRVDGVIKGAQVVSKKYNYDTKSSIVVTKLQMGKDLLAALLSDPKLLSWNEKIEQMWDNLHIMPRANATTYSLQEKETILKLMKDLRGNSEAEKYFEGILSSMKNSPKYTGLLLDISDLDSFKKALIVKLVDENGIELYPSSIVSKQTLTRKNTSVGYMFGFDDARQNKRVFDNPIEMKVKNTYKNKLSNIVLSKKQIEQLNSLDKNVLSKAKVILVLGD